MTKRQDPIIKSMIIWLINSMKGKDTHCFTHAIINFLIMGIQTDWRGIKWAQPKWPIKHGFYEFNKASSQFNNQFYALCIKNFMSNYASGRIVTNHMSDRQECCSFWYWLALSKQSQPRTKIEFEALSPNPKFCFVLATLCIYQRFALLCNKPNPLVAMYRKNTNRKSCTWLIKCGIESKLRLAAWKVFYPKEEKSAASWQI